MSLSNLKKYKIYVNFLSTLAKDLNKFYYLKLKKKFKISNKLKNNLSYSIVTSILMNIRRFLEPEL